MKKVALQPLQQKLLHIKSVLEDPITRRVDGFCDLNWLSSESNDDEEDTFQRYAIWKRFYVGIGGEPPICLVH